MGRLADAVQAGRRNGPACGFLTLREQLPTQEDRNDLDALARDEGVSCAVIVQQLSAVFGLVINVSTLRRHRRGILGRADGCTCPR
jgi:hypothetical protein